MQQKLIDQLERLSIRNRNLSQRAQLRENLIIKYDGLGQESNWRNVKKSKKDENGVLEAVLLQASMKFQNSNVAVDDLSDRAKNRGIFTP
ncbi:MAG: hypothetical protein EZS28_001091 [Streblomastix strix]|uniref:Uncharacterized protein n=1 Tax=Streblomastix strix TaxID=222440 RepID=A0A5J4X884_9EUKA|nr:MAG: hypothetical protein EZS28_001091 [Streblomastix strix]